MPRTALALLLLTGAVLSAGLALTTPFSSPHNAQATASCPAPDLSIDLQEQALLRQINQYRTQHGLGPLTISANLNRSASWMARDMAVKDYFSHTDSLGRTAAARIRQCGGLGGAGENILSGQVVTTARKALDLWRASPGHNANLLYPEYGQIGIARYNSGGYWGWYWVTTFSTQDDGTNVNPAR